MFVAKSDLEKGISEIKNSPIDKGSVDLIVRRPEKGDREIIEFGELDEQLGLVGDNWVERGSKKSPDGSAILDMQLSLMNSRCISLIAKTKDRWALAGDQFFVHFDLSQENVPAGTILSIGTAKIIITSTPHIGCWKFIERYGRDALVFVHSTEGRKLNLRGVNARVLKPGVVSVGDKVSKCA